MTIDDIVFVIDCGLMKEKRYDPTKSMESLDSVGFTCRFYRVCVSLHFIVHVRLKSLIDVQYCGIYSMCVVVVRCGCRAPTHCSGKVAQVESKLAFVFTCSRDIATIIT